MAETWRKIAFEEEICGSTFPTSPRDGQLFVHEVTGRKILYTYDLDNTEWIPIQSIGAMTMYVDGTDGTDDTSHGTGVDTDAFATVQYAVDMIPAVYTGDVIIYIAAGTYAETVTIQGKNSSGNYSISIYGTLTESASGTADSKTTGSGATQGTLTDTGAFGSYDNKLVYITATGEYRVIDSDTSDVITICGTFSDDSNLAYKVYDWGTEISRIITSPKQTGIYLYDLSLVSSGTCLESKTNSQLTVQRCELIESGSRAIFIEVLW